MKWLDDWVFIDEKRDGKWKDIILTPVYICIILFFIYFQLCGF